MKKEILLILVFLMTTLITEAQQQNPNYDASLAARLGSDDYGMKQYVFVILKTGSAVSADSAFRDSCFRGHMKNIHLLVEKGKLIVAGPFGKNENKFRGIFILNVKTFAEAQDLLKDDTAIRENFLEPEYYNWYGSAALPEYLEAADKIWKEKP